jgi:hypothetical protein
MDPRVGVWVTTNPEARQKANVNEGFRISQLQFAHAPFIKWEQDIVYKYENSPRANFYNDVLGLEYDDGVTPITEGEIRRCCKDYQNGTWWGAPRKTYMGIDWGPANSADSYTLVTILSVNEKKIPVLVYMKRFTGAEASFEHLHEEIPKIAHHWNVSLIGADRGMGEASNAELRKRMGFNKLFEFQHSSTLKQKMPQWNPKGLFYVTNRNNEISELFGRIKKEQIIFPNFNCIEHPHVDDLLAVSIDYDEKHNKMSYINSDPDDTIHSIIYGLLAARIDGAFESEYIY